MQSTCERRAEERLLSHCCCGNGTSITYFELTFLALVNQNAKRMCSITLLCVPVWIAHIFLHYLIKDTIFGKRVTENKVCSDFLDNFCLIHASL